MTARQVSMAPQGTRAWLEARKDGIGASDVAAVLGISPWQTPLDVWLSKQPGYEAAGMSEPMRWGHVLEPVVRDRYQSDQPAGVVVDTVDGVLAHPTRDWMRASLDGLVHSSDGSWVLEVKTSRRGFDTIPDHYLTQAYWQLGVTSLDRVDFACLFAGSDYRVFTVESDATQQRDISDYCGWWWGEHVVGGRMPDPDPVRDAPKLKSLWRPVPELGAEIDADLAVELVEAKQDLDVAKDRFAEVAARVQIEMGEATVATVDGSPVASWTATAARRTVDTTRLKAAGLYDEYTRVGQPGRMFKVK